MFFEVAEDRNHPGDWRVEAIDHASEGECHVAVFSGNGAEEMAREYAAWMDAREEVLPSVSKTARSRRSCSRPSSPPPPP